jgi:hypothetical protein
MSVQTEQRRHARVVAQAPLTVRAERQPHELRRMVVGRLVDACPVGVAFAPDEAVEPGEEFQLSISEPHGGTCLAGVRAHVVATTLGSAGEVIAHCSLDERHAHGDGWLAALNTPPVEPRRRGSVARVTTSERPRLADDEREALRAWQRVDPVGLAYWFWESVPSRDVVAGRSAGLDDLQWLVWPALQAEPLGLGQLLAAGRSAAAEAALDRARIDGQWVRGLKGSLKAADARTAAAQKLAREQPSVIGDLFAWLLEPDRDERVFKEEVGSAGTMFYLPTGIHPDAYRRFYDDVLEREDWATASEERRAQVREEAIWSVMPDLAPLPPQQPPQGPPLFLTETSLGYLLHLIEVVLGADAMTHAKQRIAALYGYD